jgi:hypothetical protein
MAEQSLFERVVGRAFNNTITRQVEVQVREELKKKASETPLIMQKEYKNFIPATTSNSAIMMYNWHRVVTIVEKLIQSNAVGKRFLEIIRDHVFGQGVEFNVSTTNEAFRPYLESANEEIRKTWQHPRNNFDAVIPTWIFEDAAYGEVAIPVETAKLTGDCWFGYLPVKNIASVNVSAFNYLDVLSIKVQNFTFKNTKRNEWKPIWQGHSETLNTVRYNSNEFEVDGDGEVKVDKKTNLPIPNLEYGRITGNVFFYRSLNTLSTIRGVGDLFHSLDQLLTFDQALIDVWNSYDTQRAVTWDMTIENGTQELIDKYAEMPLPTGNLPFVHDQRIKLEPKAPAIKVEDLSQIVRTFMVILCGSVGIPEFAMGDGSQTNVATAYEQMPTLYAKYTNRRKTWQSRLQQILRFILERKNEAGMLRNDKGEMKRFTIKELNDFMITVEFKPFERNNGSEMATMFSTLVQTLTVVKQNGWITDETAAKAARTQLTQFGVEIDEQVELADLKSERDKKAMLTGQSSSTGKPVDYTGVTR